MEEWRYIELDELQKHSYMISNFGNVKSEDRVIKYSNGQVRKLDGKILTKQVNSSGYAYVRLNNHENVVNLNIHREVYKAFIGDIPENNIVHHIDHNRLNNNVENLATLTLAENAIEQGIYNKGIRKNSNNTIDTNECRECGTPISRRSTYCQKHAYLLSGKRYKNGLIEKDTLVELLTKENGNFTIVGKELGITDNAVRKWCKKYDLPYRTKEWKHLIN